jgi:hypothetical protein
VATIFKIESSEIMKNKKLFQSILLFGLILFSAVLKAQNPQNWTMKEVMEPSELAASINAKKDLPVIISVGPGATIPNSVAIGMINNKEGLDKLNAELDKLSKEKRIVVYCGCCPFEHCPNVRPAIDALKKGKFTNYFLLNLPRNIKTDWIDKGYPVSKS